MSGCGLRVVLATAIAISFTGSFADFSAHAQDAADAYFDAEDMAKARSALHHHHGASLFTFLQAERLEYQSHGGDPLLLWDAQGWVGGDINKFWLKTEGEYLLEEDAFEEAEVQALYSRAITPFFDAQIGVRHDFEPDPSRSHVVIGLQGLAPYLFEIDAAMFISSKGDVTARIEAEYELLITQRLILQPRAELELAAQDVEELAIGSGLSNAAVGARLRYEIKREIAPYVGVSWSRALGDTADLVRADGEEPGSVSFVAGVRLWF